MNPAGRGERELTATPGCCRGNDWERREAVRIAERKSAEGISAVFLPGRASGEEEGLFDSLPEQAAPELPRALLNFAKRALP